MSLVSKHIRMSANLAEWYEERSKEIGISQTNLMVMALSEYIKQEKALDVMSKMEGLVNELKGQNTQKRE